MTHPGARPVAWITGAAGLIGSHLVRTAPTSPLRWRLHPLTRSELDLLDLAAVRERYFAEKPELVIHCAALSQSPACQKDPGLAWKLNVDVTAHLAELARDIPLVFFSTDLVFDGRKGSYTEADDVNPLSVYGETKVAAERIVLANPRHLIIRTSLNGGMSPSGDRGFNEQLRRAFERGEQLSLFTDEFRNPIPAEVTARAAWELVALGEAGLFHVAGSERLSRWEIGRLIASRWPQLQPGIRPESLASYKGAPRSPDTSLDSTKAQALLSFPLPGLTDWLKTAPPGSF